MSDEIDQKRKGAPKPELQELPRVIDRLSFIYLEHARITKKDSALVVEDKEGIIRIPSHSFLVIILGPGINLTHRAMELIADSGVTFVWTGESGLKYYAHGRALSKNSAFLIQQAKVVSNPRLHLEAVRKMYQLRFPDEIFEGLTLQQLRGKEGSRVKKIYYEESVKWGVPWQGRNYNPNDFKSGDPVNRALSVGNACLYGIVTAVICALGLSPGLGLIHTGLELSLVYDIADLYKAEIVIPEAFRLASESSLNIETRMRKVVRQLLHENKIIRRMVRDIGNVFDVKELDCDAESLRLWDGKRESKQAGIQYLPRDEK
ncbi:type I-E CRISPR-associated endonuclease Cas1e [Ileibacterium valens]|uniref:type I-E CRISPR-associated endonuclease Cas1e n=1 Tax=Ileibacterium valens TaxID=1862668 RepID=UPI00235495BD|nr:type I-E CRISPR-associated endonuclease Cas1e [Ileibacterium valens]